MPGKFILVSLAYRASISLAGTHLVELGHRYAVLTTKVPLSVTPVAFFPISRSLLPFSLGIPALSLLWG